MNERACFLCGGEEARLVQKGARHAPELEVRRCLGCELVFLWPRPSTEELDAYYAHAYRLDYQEPPVEERFRQDMDEARTRVRRLLPSLGRDARLLEVGSGSGAFLDAVRPYVREVQGLEPDERSRAWIRERLGLSLPGSLRELRDAGERFDLLVLFHVLEHTGDPRRFLEDLRPLVRPGGTVVVEVPNVDDGLVALYRVPRYLAFYYQKAHLYYFSRSTLGRTLELSGLKATVGEVQRYDLGNHLRWMLTGEPGGQGYYDHVLPPSVHAAYGEALVRAGHADTLWALASPRDTL